VFSATLGYESNASYMYVRPVYGEFSFKNCFYFCVYILFFMNPVLYKGQFTAMNTGHAAVFVDISDSAKGHVVVNCSFENIRGTDSFAPCIHIYRANANINISDSIFKNISSSNSSPNAGAIYYFMNTDLNNNYSILGNTFIEIKTNKSVIQLTGSFSSLTFSYNSFYNVSSSGGGGVFIIINFIQFFNIYLGSLGGIYNNRSNS
jgi:hypothetical protein